MQFRGDHLSNTTCLTQVFFKSGNNFANYGELDTTNKTYNK